MNLNLPLVAFTSVALALGSVVPCSATPVSVFLDADTPATGSNLDTTPLVTPYGVITFLGEIGDDASDPEFIAAGALGDVFDIDDASDEAILSFDFDVVSATFIYGGNLGVFDIEARDIGGAVVDSFFQADTYGRQPAGPITLYGPGIRSLRWQDPGYNFAAIDNLVLEIPEPSTLTLLGMGAIGLLVVGWRRRKH